MIADGFGIELGKICKGKKSYQYDLHDQIKVEDLLHAVYIEPSFIHPNSQSFYTTCPAHQPEAHAHWKLNPPKWPVTSIASPTKI